MSLFFRRGAERRTGPVSDAIRARGLGAPGSFRVAVSESTAEQVVAFDAGASLLADVISCLPFNTWTGTGAGQRPGRAPRWLDDPGGAGYGLDDWVKQLVYSACFTGNIVLTVEARTGSGAPDVVAVRDWRQVMYNGGWIIAGKRYVREDVIHYRRYPRPGSRFGSSPIERHATTLGISLASARFGRQWFDDGAHPQSTLESDEWLDEDEVSRLRGRIIDPSRGTREPLILGGGLKLKAWQVSPEESQFLATQGYSAAESCRILGPAIAEILGYPTGDSSTYKNRQELAVDFLKYALDPWLVPIEKLISRLMGGDTTMSGRYVSADRAAVLRTDLLTRYQAARIALGPSEPFATANEVRLPEPGWGPVPWGDEKPTIQGSDQTPATTTQGGQ